MNRKSYTLIAILLFTIVFASCNNTDVLVEPSDFAISIDTLKTYKVGDTLQFSIKGGFVDQIVFFSGELVKDYNNSSRTVSAGKPKLVFQTARPQGVLNGPDSLRLMISTNLKGYDSINVVSANWTDITNRNAKWPSAISSTFVTSDSIDLSDFNNLSDSINIAFLAKGKKVLTGKQSRWQINNLTLGNFLPDGTVTPLFSTFDNTGWSQVSMKNSTFAWNVGTWGVSGKSRTLNSSGITIRTSYPIEFNPGSGVNVDDNVDWLITSTVNLKKVTPDIGITLKNAMNLTMTNYSYIYKKPGNYTITFVASNVKGVEMKRVVRQVRIKILP